MRGNFKPYNQDQIFLFPKSLKDFIPKGHLVYLIDDIVEKFDLNPIIQKYSTNGCRAYAPVMLTKILFYAYCTGVYSSRKIAQRLEDNVFFMYLSAMQYPDFRTISDFRKNHLRELSEFFVEVLRLCQELKLVRFGHISLDGSKVKANASRHKAMSYGRMQKKKDELEREVEELLKKAQRIDEEEDKEYGDKRGDELPEELQFKESRLRKIKEAMERLEKEAKEKGGEKPKDKAQASFTDKDSRIMKTPFGFQYAYNAQCAVDDANQVIVAQDVSNSGSDRDKLKPMIRKVKKNTGRRPEKLSADNGYLSEVNLKYLKRSKIDGYIAVGNEKKLNKESSIVEVKDKQASKLKKEMLNKLRSEEGSKVYKRRKAITEPVFGQIKWAREFRQFSCRGLKKAKGEFALLCTAHNILKIWRFMRSDSTNKGREIIYQAGKRGICLSTQMIRSKESENYLNFLREIYLFVFLGTKNLLCREI
jgi:transposase